MLNTCKSNVVFGELGRRKRGELGLRESYIRSRLKAGVSFPTIQLKKRTNDDEGGVGASFEVGAESKRRNSRKRRSSRTNIGPGIKKGKK